MRYMSSAYRFPRSRTQFVNLAGHRFRASELFAVANLGLYRDQIETDLSTKDILDAGWSSPVARQAHNLKVVGSNPTPATKIYLINQYIRCISKYLKYIFLCAGYHMGTTKDQTKAN